MSSLFSLNIPPGVDPTGGLPAPYARPFVDDLASYWFDIVLLGVLAVFVLAFLPRAIVRYWSGPMLKGLLLRSGKIMPTIPRLSMYSQEEHAASVETHVADMSDDWQSVHDMMSDDSQTLHDESIAVPSFPSAKFNKPSLFKQLTSSSFFKHPAAPGMVKFCPPIHFPTWSSLVYPIGKYVNKSVSMGVTYGQVLVVLAYIGGLIFVSGYYANPFLSVRRSGSLAMSQLPVLFTLASKNSIVGFLVGAGYEKLNFYHRVVSIAFLILSHLHVLPYMYWWIFAGNLQQQLQITLNVWGIVSLVAFDILWISSLTIFRRRAYNFFLFGHIIGITVGVIAAVIHYPPVSAPYAIVAAGIFFLDQFLKTIKTRISVATIRPIPDLSLTHLEIPGLNKGWRAGQHVRLRVISMELGFVGSSEVHPFTIASASESEMGTGLVLLIKKVGTWTNTLYTMANKGSIMADEEAAARGEQGVIRERKVRVIVEGPYGGLGNMLFASYSAVVLVSGGSGVTFSLAAAEELLQDIAKGKARTKFIDFVWTVQDKAAFIPLIPTLNFFMTTTESLPGISLRFHLSYTRAGASTSISPDDKEKMDPYATLDSRVEIKAGRPKLMKILDNTVGLTAALGSGRHEGNAMGIAIGVCGPLGLVEQVKRTSAGVSDELRNAVGGIEVHEEVFEW